MAYLSNNDFLINHSYINPYQFDRNASNQDANKQEINSPYSCGYSYQNKAQEFEEWTVSVDMGEAKPDENFKFVREGKIRPKEYKQDAKQLAYEYIDMFDTDGDGQISYEEFENYNVQELYDNVFSVSEKELKSLKKDLKRI